MILSLKKSGKELEKPGNMKKTDYKIGIIGSRDAILGFKGLGIDIFPVNSLGDIKKSFDDITKENYGIVFITENWADQAKEEIAEIKKRTLPAIISVPSQQGSTGAGLQNLRKIVEQAVGSDILFKE
jgi:V/A-type H+-transporting ATPase subunit F